MGQRWSYRCSCFFATQNWIDIGKVVKVINFFLGPQNDVEASIALVLLILGTDARNWGIQLLFVYLFPTRFTPHRYTLCNFLSPQRTKGMSFSSHDMHAVISASFFAHEGASKWDAVVRCQFPVGHILRVAQDSKGCPLKLRPTR